MRVLPDHLRRDRFITNFYKISNFNRFIFNACTENIPKQTRGPRQLGNSQLSLSQCMKLAIVMASTSFLPHQKISIRTTVIDDQNFKNSENI